MTFEIKGLKELQNKLKAIDGQQNVPLTEMLTPSFMASCSSFTSAEALFEASEFEINNDEDFKAIPDIEWDSFIGNNTSYPNWSEMLKAAGTQWTIDKLGLSS
jgi:hypothetical protein